MNAVDKERLKDQTGTGRRFPFGLPRADNANYLWIQLFYAALNEQGRAGFVMANSASDARSSEQDLRQRLIEANAVDAVVAVGPNMFYTVTLPCTLWFFDKGKSKTDRKDKVLFVDARHIYRQVTRAVSRYADAECWRLSQTEYPQSPCHGWRASQQNPQRVRPFPIPRLLRVR